MTFDSVSRMSRDADEGFRLYEELYNKNISLYFLKEPHINTDVYKQVANNRLEMTGETIDCILNGINEYMLLLAKEQIKLAEFELGQEPILKKGIFTITEHFLIASSKIQLYLLPLDKIVWVYKHSSLHRLSFKHVHITYTLRVIAKKKLKLVASMQPKEDVDAVIDHISAYCPDALINYSRENEQLARVRQQL